MVFRQRVTLAVDEVDLREIVYCGGSIQVSAVAVDMRVPCNTVQLSID
jgi:hypothetical protein